MRVFDCFTFFGELDLLEIRLRYLWDHVDIFVIVEAPFTFSGNPKPLYFADHMNSRFHWALGKVRHVVSDGMKPSTSCAEDRWSNEVHQRRQIWRGLWDMQAGDWVMVGDVDEIPDLHAVKRLPHMTHPPSTCSFRMTSHCYYADRYVHGQEWFGTQAVLWPVAFDAQTVRDSRGSGHVLNPGGWHLSYMGGAETISRKLSSFAHAEFDTPHYNDPARIKTAIAADVIFLDGVRLSPYPVDQLPHTLRPDLYPQFFKY